MIKNGDFLSFLKETLFIFVKNFSTKIFGKNLDHPPALAGMLFVRALYLFGLKKVKYYNMIMLFCFVEKIFFTLLRKPISSLF
jgi:hypothetical protein